jgi:regulator of protease activity HflC (stomatin/prohibitin superfamily)
MELFAEIDKAILAWILLSLLFIGVIFVILIVAVGSGSVPQGMQWTVERLGKYTRTLQPGLRFILPIIERISNKVDMREQVMDVHPQEVITKDNVLIRVDAVVFYKVFDPEKATYQVSDLSESIMHLTITNIRTVMGSMVLDDLLSKRDEINVKLFAVIDEITDPWGIKITRIEIKDITPPKDLVETMGRQMKAERGKRAAILEAEGQRKAAVEQAEGERHALILKAEGEKEAAILKAQGEKEAAILKAEARRKIEILDAETRHEHTTHEVYAREQTAAAEAKATTMMSEAIMKGDIQSVNYFIALKYVEALQSIATADNQKLIMMPLETSNIISSIAGIGDIAKEIFANKSNGNG